MRRKERCRMSNGRGTGGGLLAGPGIMLISAALFGFFGFFSGITWNALSMTTGKPILFVVMLGWTLRLSAIVRRPSRR